MAGKYKEHILAVKASAVKEKITHDGLKGFFPFDITKTKDADSAFGFSVDDTMVGSRNILEDDFYWKQLIPYAIIKSDDYDDDEPRYLAYRRTPKAGENKLHGKASIGFAGHINIDDVCGKEEINLYASVLKALNRELDEELPEDVAIVDNNFVGFINDDGNDVGKVHLGCLLIVEVEDLEEGGESCDEGINIIGFLTLDEVLELENLEEWSRISVEALKRDCKKAIAFSSHNSVVVEL